MDVCDHECTCKFKPKKNKKSLEDDQMLRTHTPDTCAAAQR